MFYALLIAITVQSIGLLILKNLNIIEVPAETFPVIGTILGSFVFGIGIVLAGGCATGTWYRAMGLIGRVALIFYALTSAVTKTGVLLPIMNQINKPTQVSTSMTSTTGIPQWILVMLLTVITIFLVVKTIRKPKIMVPQLKQKYSGIRHYLFEKDIIHFCWHCNRFYCSTCLAYE